VSLYIFDLDGVIYLGERLLPGVRETLSKLRKKGDQVSFLTNNSTLSRSGFQKKLTQMGIEVHLEELFPSSYLAAIYLSHKTKKKNTKVLVFGEKGLFEELSQAAVKLTSTPKDADYVVVGMDRKFNFEKLKLAYEAILNGAKFVATNKDVTYPTEEGTVPAAGAIVKALEVSTHKRALLLGKPHLFGLKTVMRSKGYAPTDTILVGDRLETDILAGKRLKVATVLVLSGITLEKTLQKAPPSLKPDYVIQSLSNLPSLKIKHA
jgi:phosphoglycolate/pyridoxal phosphate phosphatase family enzyme